MANSSRGERHGPSFSGGFFVFTSGEPPLRDEDGSFLTLKLSPSRARFFLKESLDARVRRCSLIFPAVCASFSFDLATIGSYSFLGKKVRNRRSSRRPPHWSGKLQRPRRHWPCCSGVRPSPLNEYGAPLLTGPI